MLGDIDAIVTGCFRELPPAFETGIIGARAEAELYNYVRYWMALDSPRERIMVRCETLIRRIESRARLGPEQAERAARVRAQLLALCQHHYAGLSTLRRVK